MTKTKKQPTIKYMTKFAIIKTGGKQYKVKEGDIILIDKLLAPKKTLEFKDVFLYSNEKDTKIGAPKISGIKVEAEVLKDEVKGDKVITVKYKAKKRFKKTVGFRPRYTQVKITKIS